MPNLGWPRELECTADGNGNRGCGATVLIREADLFQTSAPCQGYTDYFVTYACPRCGRLTDTDEYRPGPHALPRRSERAVRAAPR